MESLESTWIPVISCVKRGGMGWTPWTPYGKSGIQVEADNNLAGLPAKEIPPGLHVEHVDSMDSIWIPSGIYGGG